MGEISRWVVDRGGWTPVPSLMILVSAVLVLSCGQTDRQTDRIIESHTQRRMIAILTTVSVSSNNLTIIYNFRHIFSNRPILVPAGFTLAGHNNSF